MDVKHILKGNSRLFRNSWLAIRPWNSDIQQNLIILQFSSHVDSNLGFSFKIKSKQMGAKINAKMGEVMEA